MIAKIRYRLRPVFNRLEAFGFACVRTVLYARGKDITDSFVGERTLVIAPHEDDETLGAGVATLRLVEKGKTVHITVVTDGRNSHRSEKISIEELAAMRKQEMIDACALLGVPKERVYFGPCEDRYVWDKIEPCYQHLRGLVEAIKPDVIFSPSGIDRHKDHRAVAAVVARLMDDGIITCPVYEYPVWFYSVRTWTDPDKLTFSTLWNLFWKPAKAAFTLEPRLIRSNGYLPQKRKALEAHRSQMFNITGEKTWLVLPPDWLKNFFRKYELFFPLRPEAAKKAAAEARGAANG